MGGLQIRFKKKFEGSFDALSKMGAQYCNAQRFKALIGDGKPLWVFKEHDHRLYCERRVVDGEGVSVVLLSGWIKDKEGRINVRRTRWQQHKHSWGSALLIRGEKAK